MWIEKYEELLFSVNHTDESKISATLLKNSNIPEVVYKFRSVNDNNLNALEEGILIAVDPRNLNDPDEGDMHINFKKRWKEFYKVFMDLFYKDFGFKLAIDINDFENRDDFIIEFAKCMGIRNHEFQSFDELWSIGDKLVNDRFKLFQKEIRETGVETFRVCSLTSELNSKLMWAYYSDSYQGFCIGYDFRNLKSELTDMLLPVRYKNNKLEMDDSFFGREEINNSFIIDSLTRKSDEWSHEKEWRLLVLATKGEPIKKVKVPKPKVIIIGKDMRLNDRLKLIQLSDYLDIPCKQQSYNSVTRTYEYDLIEQE